MSSSTLNQKYSVDEQETQETPEAVLEPAEEEEELTPEQEAERVRELITEAERSVNALFDLAEEEVDRIIAETGGELDEATKRELERILDEALQAKADIESKILQKARSLNLQLDHEFEQVGRDEAMSHFEQRVNEIKFQKLLRSGSDDDFIAASKLINEINLGWSTKQEWETAVKEKFINLALSDLDEAVKLYRKLPANFIGVELAEEALWEGFKEAYPGEMSFEQEKEIIKRQFEGVPGIQVRQYRAGPLEWTPEEQLEIITSLIKDKRYRDIALFFITKMPQSSRKELAPVFFKAYLENNPPMLFSCLGSFTAQINALEGRDREVFMGPATTYDSMEFIKHLPNLDLKLDTFEAKSLISYLAHNGCDKAVSILSPEVVSKLPIDKSEIIDVLAHNAPAWMPYYLQSKQKLGREDKKELFSTISKVNPGLTMAYLYYFRDMLSTHDLSIVVDRAIEKAPSEVADAYLADPTKLPLSEEQKDRLVDALIQKNQTYYLNTQENFEVIAESPKSKQKVIDFLISTLPINALNLFAKLSSEKKSYFTEEQVSSAVEVCITKNPTEFFKTFFSKLDEFSLTKEQFNRLIENTIYEEPKIILDYVERGALVLSPDQIQSAVQRLCFKEMQNNITPENLLHITSFTEYKLEYNDQVQKECSKWLKRLPPSQFFRGQEVLNQLLPPEAGVLSVPWAQAFESLQKLQARSERAEYDPWNTDLDPLVKSMVETSLLSLDKPEDGEILVAFVQEFGMYNLPTMLEWYVVVAKSPDLKDLPEELKQEIESSLGINLDKLPNKGFLISEIKKYRQNIQSELLNDRATTEVLGTKLGKELFFLLRGKASWGGRDDPSEIMRIWEQTLEVNPEVASIPEGYQEVSFDVSLARRRELVGSEEEKLKIREAELLNNEELQKNLERFTGSYEFADNITELPSWWQEQQQVILGAIGQEISGINDRIEQSENEKAKIGMSKQLEKWQKLLNAFAEIRAPNIAEMDDAQIDDQLVEFMENLVSGAFSSNPDSGKRPEELLRVIGFNDLLRNVSALHSRKVMGEGRSQIVDESLQAGKDGRGADALNGWRNHLVDYVSEHYLHPDIVNHDITGHKPFSAKLQRELQLVWGTLNGIEKNPIVQKQKELEVLRDQGAEKSTKSMAVSMIPGRGALRIFSGDFGNACTANRHHELAEGRYPGITAYALVTGRGTKDERIRGSVLMVETKTAEGEPALVVRANNPQENFLQQVDADNLIEQILNEAKNVAARRGIKHVLVPRDGSGQSCSNRPAVSRHYQDRFANEEPVQLIDEPETNFNGYKIWNATGSNRVVKV